MSHWVGRNAAINVVGVVLPSLVGIVALRVLLESLGQSAMGVFTIALGVLGLTSILDFGLGRGITRYVASSLGAGVGEAEVSWVVLKGFLLLATVGVISGAALWWALPFLVGQLTGREVVLFQQAMSGFRWVVLSIPFALVSGGLLSFLEGYQRFSRANAVRVPVGFLVFIAPATAAVLNGSLSWALAALALVRVFGFLLSCIAARHLIQAGSGARQAYSGFGQLLRFSGWLSVSNIAGPLLVYGDRFYLATVVPTSSIAYYTVPFDVAFRATSLPSAGLNALFPAMAHANAAGADKDSLPAIARKALSLLWLPPLVIVALLSNEILGIWLGRDFAAHARLAFLILIVGVFINGFALLAAAVLHADGRSDITAKLHLVELPIYAVVVVGLILHFGVVGAALAWSFRVTLDFGFLCVAVARTGAIAVKEVWRLLASCLPAATLMALVGTLAPPSVRILASIVVTLVAMWQILRNLPSVLGVFSSAKE